MSTKRTCIVCKKEYSYCPHCDRDISKPHWMVLFCSDLCHDIESIVNDHAFGKLTDMEAIERLKRIDTSSVSDPIKNYIDQLLKKNSISENQEVFNDNNTRCRKRFKLGKDLNAEFHECS